MRVYSLFLIILVIACTLPNDSVKKIASNPGMYADKQVTVHGIIFPSLGCDDTSTIVVQDSEGYVMFIKPKSSRKLTVNEEYTISGKVTKKGSCWFIDEG